jgi:hypothetical protein
LLVLIDGPDLTGKTQLARRLEDELGFYGVKRTGPPAESSWLDYGGGAPELLGYLPGQHPRGVVCDRWHYSEAVWPYVFGRETDMDGEEFRRIEDHLRPLGAIAVYARRDQATLESALRAEPSEPVRPDQVAEVLRLYDEVMSMTTLPVIEYDFDVSDDYDPIVFLAARAEQAAIEGRTG